LGEIHPSVSERFEFPWEKKGGEGAQVGMEDIKEQVTGGQSLGKSENREDGLKKKKRDCDIVLWSKPKKGSTG